MILVSRMLKNTRKRCQVIHKTLKTTTNERKENSLKLFLQSRLQLYVASFLKPLAAVCCEFSKATCSCMLRVF